MYVDKKKKRWPGLLWILAGAAAVALLWCLAVPVSGEDMSEESARAVKAAVDRCALQCYVVEGAYPPAWNIWRKITGSRSTRGSFSSAMRSSPPMCRRQ